MQDSNLTALAILIQKFGTRIEGGAFEVIVTPTDVAKVTSNGAFQQKQDKENIHWQFFPNPTIEGEGGFVDDDSDSKNKIVWQQKGKTS